MVTRLGLGQRVLEGAAETDAQQVQCGQSGGLLGPVISRRGLG